jgi:hypothetical protein
MKNRLEELSVVMQEDGVEVCGEEWGERRVAQYTLPAGFDISPFFEGMSDDACPCDHRGIVIEGGIHVRYTDGTEEITRAGEFYHWPAGHTAWTETGLVFIAITPAVQERRLVDEQLSAQAQSGGNG